MTVSRADHPKNRNNARARRRAFSLVELITTISVIGVASAVAIPRFASSTQRYHLERSAKRLAADIDAIRQRSSMLSAPQTIMLAEDGYKVFQHDGTGAVTTQVVDFSQEPYRATLKWVITDASSDVVFDQFGLPRAGALIRVDAGSRSRLIQVAGASGRSEVMYEMSDAAITTMSATVTGTKTMLTGRRANSLAAAAVPPSGLLD